MSVIFKIYAAQFFLLLNLGSCHEKEVVRSHGILMTSEDQHDITPDHVICQSCDLNHVISKM